MIVPDKIFLTFQFVASCVDSAALIPTGVVPLATCAGADPAMQTAPTSTSAAVVGLDRFFMIQVFP